MSVIDKETPGYNLHVVCITHIKCNRNRPLLSIHSFMLIYTFYNIFYLYFHTASCLLWLFFFAINQFFSHQCDQFFETIWKWVYVWGIFVGNENAFWKCSTQTKWLNGKTWHILLKRKQRKVLTSSVFILISMVLFCKLFALGYFIEVSFHFISVVVVSRDFLFAVHFTRFSFYILYILFGFLFVQESWT